MDANEKRRVPETEVTERLRAETFFMRARGYHRLGRFEEALASLDEAVAADPTYIRAQAARAHTLRRLGRLEEAFAAVNRVLEVEPNNAVALATKGTLLQEQGRPQEGQALYEEALAAASPEDLSLLHYNFACFWANAGDVARLREHLALALKLDPGKKSVAAVDRDFKKYVEEEWFLELTAL
ncbi:MAG: tetratricopeptide repeat protein [Candidatus Coatesbacteria bacterium]|nr:MAG: tetratricopeptide repeat protein [Candidatus Coatesbacteria bacterium]